MPKGWEWKRLGEVTLKFVNGGTPSTAISEYWNGSIQWTTSKSITSCTISAGEKFISQEAIKNSATSVIPKDNVLIASRVGIGKSAVNLIDIAISQDLTGVILDKKQIVPEFLVRYLHDPKILQALKSSSRGSTIKGLQRSDLEQIEIPLPPLTIQCQIVAVLEQAEAVKRQRQEADALTGALLQSVFYEMFGDPVRNERGWGTKSFEDCMSSIIDYRGKTPTKTTSGIPLVTAKIVKDGKVLQPDEFISPEDYDTWMRRGIPQKGDVILTTEGPLGTVAQLHTDEKLAFAQRLIILRGKSDILDNTYLAQFFKSDYFQNQLKSKATGSTVEGISQGNLRQTMARIPPLTLQQQFARVVQDVERMRERQEESKREIYSLFDGLIQRAFGGELIA